MLSKSQISYIKSLHQKKYRKEHGLFIVEGHKSVIEFILSDHEVDTVYYLPEFASKLLNLSHKIKFIEINHNDNERISTLQSPQGVLALVRIPSNDILKTKELPNSYTLVLDGVQDPGNLGTIIRTAEWFGFNKIVCSMDTVEAYNPKVVQATMGSLSRVKLFYTDLVPYLKNTSLPIYGALLDGQSIYSTQWASSGIVILGNEGNGITPDVQGLVTQKITIPGFGAAESLNVAVSAAVFCSELRRNMLGHIKGAVS